MIAFPSACLPERTTFRRFRLRSLPPWCRIGLMKLRQVADDAFKWWAPKVYWYGKAPTGSEPEHCCWHNRFGYRFVLVAATQGGAASVIWKQYRVGMVQPKDRASELEASPCFTIGDPLRTDVFRNNQHFSWKCKVDIGRPIVDSSSIITSDSQYNAPELGVYEADPSLFIRDLSGAERLFRPQDDENFPPVEE